MHLKYKLLWFLLCATQICVCQNEDGNITLVSSREILEKRAFAAYQNACQRMQELSNWMSVVFKMKSLWAGSTINYLEETSGRTLGQRKNLPFPQRPRITGLECSLKSAQVTVQTYARLQSQLFFLKSILGQNFFRRGSVKLNDLSVRERIKVLNVFNNTLNDIFSKLKENTQNLSNQARSGNWSARNVIKGFQAAPFKKFLRTSTNIFQVESEQKDSERKQGGFFQTLGKKLDKIVFPSTNETIRTPIEVIIKETIHKPEYTNQENIGTAEDGIKLDKVN